MRLASAPAAVAWLHVASTLAHAGVLAATTASAARPAPAASAAPPAPRCADAAGLCAASAVSPAQGLPRPATVRGISVLQKKTVYRPAANVSTKDKAPETLQPPSVTPPRDTSRRELVGQVSPLLHAGMGPLSLLSWLMPATAAESLRRSVFEFTGGSATQRLPSKANSGQEWLMLELHLPATSLEEIHTRSGSVGGFLLDVRDNLSSSAGLPAGGISMLGIYERYQIGPQADGAEPTFTNKEVLVRFGIASDKKSTIDPQSALDTLRADLYKSGSNLLSGPMGATFINATITLKLTAGLAAEPGKVEKDHTMHVATMALPIALAATFTSVLIWLAAV